VDEQVFFLDGGEGSGKYQKPKQIKFEICIRIRLGLASK